MAVVILISARSFNLISPHTSVVDRNCLFLRTRHARTHTKSNRLQQNSPFFFFFLRDFNGELILTTCSFAAYLRNSATLYTYMYTYVCIYIFMCVYSLIGNRRENFLFYAVTWYSLNIHVSFSPFFFSLQEYLALKWPRCASPRFDNFSSTRHRTLRSFRNANFKFKGSEFRFLFVELIATPRVNHFRNTV